MSTSTLLTNLGAAKLAAALAKNSSVALSSIAVGDGGGSAVTPAVTQTALVNEVYRQTLNSLSQDSSYANVMVAEIVVPASVGGWTAREIGLLDTDGVLIAVGNLPDIVKTVSSSGSAQTLVLKMYFTVSSASAVSLTIDPSTVVATRSWILNLLYPVGEVLVTHRSGSPDTWLGLGTWARYGAGKLLGFYSDSEAEFNALDKTGGEKTHTLVAAELPSVSASIPTLPCHADGNTGGSGGLVGYGNAIISTQIPLAPTSRTTTCRLTSRSLVGFARPKHVHAATGMVRFQLSKEIRMGRQAETPMSWPDRTAPYLQPRRCC